MKMLLILPLLFAIHCSTFQSKPEPPLAKPAETEDRGERGMKAQDRILVKKLVGFVTNFTKPKNVRSKAEPGKSFTYSAVLKSNTRAGTVTFEIKPDGEKFRFNCKIVIETLSQEETVEFTSTDSAEVIRQLRIALGGSVNDND